MGFVDKTFDLKKFTRAVRRHPGTPGQKTDPHALGQNNLHPCLYDVYFQILRHDTIDISRLDFGAIGYGDIDTLENVLINSPANDLFHLSEAFRQFKPSATTGRVFI